MSKLSPKDQNGVTLCHGSYVTYAKLLWEVVDPLDPFFENPSVTFGPANSQRVWIECRSLEKSPRLIESTHLAYAKLQQLYFNLTAND
jgi:hypothetical protein